MVILPRNPAQKSHHNFMVGRGTKSRQVHNFMVGRVRKLGKIIFFGPMFAKAVPQGCGI
jgi:hypothetical protein